MPASSPLAPINVIILTRADRGTYGIYGADVTSMTERFTPYERRGRREKTRGCHERLRRNRKNRTSEADFEASIGIIEAIVAREVMANSGVLSGLDNDLAHPDDAGKPDADGIGPPNGKLSGLRRFP